MVDVLARFLLRSGTSALWASVNPVLAAGEPAIETDTKMIRIGDGITAFTSLPKISPASPVGLAVLAAADAAAAQAALGGSTVGRSVFTAANTGAAQDAIGAGAGGKAVLVAANAAAARAALGVAIGTEVQAFDQDLADFAALSGAQGDLIYRGASAWVKLAKGTAGQILAQNAGLTAPEWVTPMFSKAYNSPQTALALNTLYTFTHGLGGLPTLVMPFYVCKVAINGYSVGDYIPLTQGTSNYNGNTGPAIVASTTQIKFRTPSDALMEAISPNGTSRTNYLPANFDLLVRAWI